MPETATQSSRCPLIEPRRHFAESHPISPYPQLVVSSGDLDVSRFPSPFGFKGPGVHAQTDPPLLGHRTISKNKRAKAPVGRLSKGNSQGVEKLALRLGSGFFISRGKKTSSPLQKLQLFWRSLKGTKPPRKPKGQTKCPTATPH